jgi:serine/threonine protein phosphatase 1
MLVAARRIDSAIPMWVNNGGRECLRSYADMYPNSPTQQVIPDVVFEWIENLPILYTDSKRVYVHAALDPDSPLDQQTETFALWGRLDEKEYVGCEHLAGKLLVHGHTPRMRGPDYVPGAAINLDTGACFKGRLSCAAWDDGAEHPRVYQIGKYADGVKHWDASAYLKGKRGWVAPLTEMQQRINDSLGIVE